MVKNNLFHIESLEKIVFIGFSDVFNELIKINESLNIPTDIITSTDQSKNLKLEGKLKANKIVYKILDNEIKKYIHSIQVLIN